MHWVDRICSDYNISINELARITKTSTGTYSNAKKRGTKLKNMSYSVLSRLAHALNIYIETLIVMYD